MVTGEKFINSAALRYRLGTIFLWLGIFTWLPFIFLKLIGENPPFLLFLPFHLLGVIGGARLRSVARKELGVLPAQKDTLRLLGHMLIILGILVALLLLETCGRTACGSDELFALSSQRRFGRSMSVHCEPYQGAIQK